MEDKSKSHFREVLMHVGGGRVSSRWSENPVTHSRNLWAIAFLSLVIQSFKKEAFIAGCVEEDIKDNVPLFGLSWGRDGKMQNSFKLLIM